MTTNPNLQINPDSKEVRRRERRRRAWDQIDDAFVHTSSALYTVSNLRHSDIPELKAIHEDSYARLVEIQELLEELLEICEQVNSAVEVEKVKDDSDKPPLFDGVTTAGEATAFGKGCTVDYDLAIDRIIASLEGHTFSEDERIER